MNIANALQSLGITEWVLRGEPTSEAEFNAMFSKVVGSDDNGSAIESSDPADFGVTWAEVKAKYDELVAAEPMRLLRAERNQRLANTDWWASSDLTMTAEQRAYRQALRDITETYTSLDDVVWPEEPNV
jgi:hypothetical protein